MSVGLALDRVHQGNCVERLREIRPGSVDLVFADPPFNIGYQYDVYDDRRSVEAYLDWARQWLALIDRVLKPTGTFWLAIGDELAAELKVAASQTGLTCRRWVIWYYTFGVNCVRGFSRSHTHLFHFVKNPQQFTFNAENPAVRVPSARQLVYADARANPKGRLPDNTWILRPQDLPGGIPAIHDTWYFSRVAGTFKEREGFHGCQMPEQLLGRIIRISSHPGEIVLDPFAGSGTTLAVARKLGRRWIGIELSADYVRRIRQRLKGTRVGAPLDGPEDPLRSAPATRQGKRRGVLRAAPHVRRTAKNRRARVEQEIRKGVAAAYRAAHQGFSTDWVLADPELNTAFTDQCARRGVPGDAVIWNQTLLRVRKQGTLPARSSRRRQVSCRQMDPYLAASEVALSQLTANWDVTLDAILCDPELAALFDRTAERFAPGYAPRQYRWAALTLRKRARTGKARAARHRKWLDAKLPKPRPLADIDPSAWERPGVYVLIGRDQVNLYVGESWALGPRVAQIGATEAWQALEPVCARLLAEKEQTMAGLKCVLIQRLNPGLNWRLLHPQLDPTK